MENYLSKLVYSINLKIGIYLSIQKRGVCFRLFVCRFVCYLSFTRPNKPPEIDPQSPESRPYIRNGLLKKGGGGTFFQRQATVTKVGTNIAETLPDVPIEWNFPKMQFYAKNSKFSEKSHVFIFVSHSK